MKYIYTMDDGWATIKSFSASSIAHIYCSRLRNEGIDCRLENDLVGTVLPYPNIDIELKVRNEDVNTSNQILRLIQEELENIEMHDFSEADKRDIEFEKKLNESKKQNESSLLYPLLVLFFLLIFLYFILK